MTFKPVTEKHDKVLIIGGGTSLIGFDVQQFATFNGAIITVNNVINHIPRADYWVTVDPTRPNKRPQMAMLRQKPNTKYYCCIPNLDWLDEKTKSWYPLLGGIHYLERILPTDK